MRLVYTADLHGELTAYRALLELAAAQAAQLVIVGGDLLPRAIKLRDAITVQRGFIEQQLRPLLAEFKARRPGCAVYLLAGNDDWAAAIDALDELEHAGLALPLHGRVYQISATPLWLAGYSCVPITPFSIKDYERRDDGPAPFEQMTAYISTGGAISAVDLATIAGRPSIAEDLAGLALQSTPGRTIYVCHTPPADTPLDQMPRGRHVGSRALRAFIERHQPPLTLHGHIHESPDQSGQFAARIGTTWSINPGHSERRFQAVALDTDDIGGTITHTVFGQPNLDKITG